MTAPAAPRRVFLAGRGAVTGFGTGIAPFLTALFAGHTAIADRRRTARFAVPTAVAAEFPADTLATLAPHPDQHHDLAFASALQAAREALAEANLPAASTPLVLASTKGDLTGVLDTGTGLGLPARLAARLAKALGCPAVLGTVSTACASGLVATALATRHLRAGHHAHALVVGVDVLHEFVITGFGALHALSPEPCRPFDQKRRGVTLGEAAGALVLTTEAARSLGGELLGHGGANDACHVTGPDRQGQGLALAVRRALAQAQLEPAAIDCIHVHGTATLANDTTEALGLVSVFGSTPAAFGTKAQTGHTLGAAGVLETIALLAALQRGRVPQNQGLETSDVDPHLDLVRSPRHLTRARTGLKVASGFGGVQAALVVGT